MFSHIFFFHCPKHFLLLRSVLSLVSCFFFNGRIFYPVLSPCLFYTFFLQGHLSQRLSSFALYSFLLLLPFQLTIYIRLGIKIFMASNYTNISLLLCGDLPKPSAFPAVDQWLTSDMHCDIIIDTSLKTTVTE